MPDYSWIKPGVQAVIVPPKGMIDSRNMASNIITIASEPYIIKSMAAMMGARLVCDYEEDPNAAIACAALQPLDKGLALRKGCQNTVIS